MRSYADGFKKVLSNKMMIIVPAEADVTIVRSPFDSTILRYYRIPAALDIKKLCFTEEGYVQLIIAV